MEHRAHQVGKASCGDAPVICLTQVPTTGLRQGSLNPFFHVCSGILGAGPHAVMVRTLPTETYCQTLFLSLFASL